MDRRHGRPVRLAGPIDLGGYPLFQFVENADEAFFMSSPDMTSFEYVSRAYQTIWGRRPGSFEGSARQVVPDYSQG